MDVFAPGAKKEITLLCVSDTHQHFENISKVMAQVARTDIDYVIHSGDWTDITVAEQVDPLKVAEAEASISSQLSQLEAIVKPVYYIPGNHDPKTLFPSLHSEVVSLSPYSKLLTVEPTTLAPGLAIVGFGGAPPGYRREEKVFGGYPYDSQGSYEEAFDREVKAGEPDTQYIVVTHSGPTKLPTSTVVLQESDTQSASARLLAYLLTPVPLTQQNNVVLNIHGHMHPCVGLASIGTNGCTKVLNPGSVC